MADEQRFNIPLDSPLEVETDDMVVPVSQPTFAWNDQQFNAGIMANSFRYEQQGWVAGKYAYFFDEEVYDGDFWTNWPDGLPPRPDGSPRCGTTTDTGWGLKDANGIAARFALRKPTRRLDGTVSEDWARSPNYYTLKAATSKTNSIIEIKVDAYTHAFLKGTSIIYEGVVYPWTSADTPEAEAERERNKFTFSIKESGALSFDGQLGEYLFIVVQLKRRDQDFVTFRPHHFHESAWPLIDTLVKVEGTPIVTYTFNPDGGNVGVGINPYGPRPDVWSQIPHSAVADRGWVDGEGNGRAWIDLRESEPHGMTGSWTTTTAFKALEETCPSISFAVGDGEAITGGWWINVTEPYTWRFVRVMAADLEFIRSDTRAFNMYATYVASSIRTAGQLVDELPPGFPTNQGGQWFNQAGWRPQVIFDCDAIDTANFYLGQQYSAFKDQAHRSYMTYSFPSGWLSATEGATSSLKYIGLDRVYQVGQIVTKGNPLVKAIPMKAIFGVYQRMAYTYDEIDGLTSLSYGLGAWPVHEQFRITYNSIGGSGVWNCDLKINMYSTSYNGKIWAEPQIDVMLRIPLTGAEVWSYTTRDGYIPWLNALLDDGYVINCTDGTGNLSRARRAHWMSEAPNSTGYAAGYVPQRLFYPTDDRPGYNHSVSSQFASDWVPNSGYTWTVEGVSGPVYSIWQACEKRIQAGCGWAQPPFYLPCDPAVQNSNNSQEIINYTVSPMQPLANSGVSNGWSQEMRTVNLTRLLLTVHWKVRFGLKKDGVNTPRGTEIMMTHIQGARVDQAESWTTILGAMQTYLTPLSNYSFSIDNVGLKVGGTDLVFDVSDTFAAGTITAKALVTWGLIGVNLLSAEHPVNTWSIVNVTYSPGYIDFVVRGGTRRVSARLTLDESRLPTGNVIRGGTWNISNWPEFVAPSNTQLQSITVTKEGFSLLNLFRDNSKWRITLDTPQLAADASSVTGALDYSNITAVQTDAQGVTTVTASSAIGTLVWMGKDDSYVLTVPVAYNVEGTEDDTRSGWTRYYIIVRDLLQLYTSLYGMTTRAYLRLEYVEHDEIVPKDPAYSHYDRFIFTDDKYPDKEFIFRIGGDPQVTRKIIARDFHNDRDDAVLLMWGSGKTEYTLDEQISYVDMPEEADGKVANDKNAQEHKYWALDSEYVLETSRAMCCMWRNGERIGESVPFGSLFIARDGEYVAQYGVSSSVDGSVPHIWALVVGTNTKQFGVYFTEVVYTGLETEQWKWMTEYNTRLVFHRGWAYHPVYLEAAGAGIPSTTEISYYPPDLTAQQLCNGVVVSAVTTNRKLSMGLKLDRGMGQWTLVGLSTAQIRVVTGFGSLGVNGWALGNWLPTNYVSRYGFNKAVKEGPIPDAEPIFEDKDKESQHYTGKQLYGRNSIYNDNGTLLFPCIDASEGYTYGINILTGEMMTMPQMSSEITFTRILFRANGRHQLFKSTSYAINGLLKLGALIGRMIGSIIDACINTVWFILSLGTDSDGPGISIGSGLSSLFDPLQVPAPGTMNAVTVNTFAGVMHTANTWLTTTKRGKQIWNPNLVSKGGGCQLADPFTDMIVGYAQKLIGMGIKALSNELAQVDTTEEVVTDPETGAQTTVTKQGGLGRRVSGAFDAAFGGIADVFGQFTGVGSTGIMDAMLPVMGTGSAYNGFKAIVSNTTTALSASINQQLGLDGQEFISSVSKAEIHVDDAVIPCCSADQEVYSGPGFFSVQLARVNRRLEAHQSEALFEGHGAVVNLFAIAPVILVGSTGISLPQMPMGLPVNFPRGRNVDTDSEEAPWIGSQHVYIAGPLPSQQSVTFKQSSCKYESYGLVGAELNRDTYAFADESNFSLVNGNQALEMVSNSMQIIKRGKWINEQKDVTITANASVIVGTSSSTDETGEQLATPPSHSTPAVYDANIIDDLWVSFGGDDIAHCSIGDTKIIDGPFTNIVKSNGSLIVASPYNVVKATLGVDVDNLKMYNVAGGLRMNKTGVNYIQGLSIMHAFDGYSNRIKSWVGLSGVGEDANNVSQYLPYREPLVLHSMIPPNSFFGKFGSLPTIEYSQPVNVVMTDQTGLVRLKSVSQNTNRDIMQFIYSIPVFFRRSASYPAGIQTIDGYKLYVIDGITSLTTPARVGSIHSIHTSRDAMIYGKVFRSTDEYLATGEQRAAVFVLNDVAMTVGMKTLGADTKSILLWNRQTRQLYRFTGHETIDKIYSAFRIKDIDIAEYEFLRQELITDTLMQGDGRARTHIRFERLKPVGTLAEPWFPVIDQLGTSSGFIEQGDRVVNVIVNNYDDDMLKRMVQDREALWTTRVKGDTIADFFTSREWTKKPPADGAYYWDPFHLQTPFLGIDDNTDCQFEWLITFAFTEWMYELVGDKYVTVFIGSETSCPGGNVASEVTRLRLRNDMFQRNNNRIGYYTFRYNGRTGAGNGERLYVWSDGVMALRKLEMIARPVTQNRTAPLLTQADFYAVAEF